MRINTNVAALQAQQNLGRTNAAAQSSMAKLSSGFRITKAGDDAAGLSIANSLRTNVRSLTQASRNIEQAQSVLSVAEGAASSIEKIVERMKELAVQAASDTNSEQLTALDDEYQALAEEIDRIVGSTTFQGNTLIDGTYETTGLQIQVGGSDATDDRIEVKIGDMAAATLFGTLGDLTSQANAVTAMGAADTAIEAINGELSSIGALQNRLDYAQENVRTAIVNNSAAESVIRDVDMAEEMTKFSKQQILQQAGTAMLAQANQSSQAVLQLLRG
jgi:flagellin